MAYSLEMLIGPTLGPLSAIDGVPPLTVVALPHDLGLLPLVPELLKGPAGGRGRWRRGTAGRPAVCEAGRAVAGGELSAGARWRM